MKKPMLTKLMHMIHTAEFTCRSRPKYIRMNDQTLKDYFVAIKPGWSGRDIDGIPIIIDDSLEHCEIGILFDVGREIPDGPRT